MERLNGVPGVKVIMTSGEYHAKHRCLVGPSLGALFETLRVDKAFLSVDGVTARFGASSADERLALAARRFIDASRETFVLADHSIVGVDANHRIAPLDPSTKSSRIPVRCLPTGWPDRVRHGGDRRRRGAGRAATAGHGREPRRRADRTSRLENREDYQ